MNDVVFILGAGASADAGVPLMANFLDRSRDLLAGGRVDDAKAQFDLVFRGITALQQVHSKANVDIHNVEAVFSAFEMAKLLGAFGALTLNELESLLDAMPVVIARTVEETMMLRVEKSRETAYVLPPQEYFRLADLVEKLLASTRPQRNVTILSFNYDVGMELALNRKDIPFSNGLNKEQQRLAVLKLHGSLAWFRCECGTVADYPISRYPWDAFALRSFEVVPLRIGALARNGRFCHCAEKTVSGPVIVPPIWNKVGYHALLSAVWSAAADRLRSAESIVAIGYSLPETDAFFRYLYALGSVGELPLRRFWVFNPDESGATEGRFRSLLGRGSENRFAYFQNNFHNFLNSEQAKEIIA